MCVRVRNRDAHEVEQCRVSKQGVLLLLLHLVVCFRRRKGAKRVCVCESCVVFVCVYSFFSICRVNQLTNEQTSVVAGIPT